MVLLRHWYLTPNVIWVPLYIHVVVKYVICSKYSRLSDTHRQLPITLTATLLLPSGNPVFLTSSIKLVLNILAIQWKYHWNKGSLNLHFHMKCISEWLCGQVLAISYYIFFLIIGASYFLTVFRTFWIAVINIKAKFLYLCVIIFVTPACHNF